MFQMSSYSWLSTKEIFNMQQYFLNACKLSYSLYHEYSLNTFLLYT